MRFKNLKASDLEGRVDLPGLSEWLGTLSGDETSVLITAPAGTGKMAAVGAIARRLQHDVMQCDLLQVFEYPDTHEALNSILRIAENVRGVIFQADGIDRMADRFRQAGDADAADAIRAWLVEKRDALRSHGVAFVATGRHAAHLPEGLRAAFDKVFDAG